MNRFLQRVMQFPTQLLLIAIGALLFIPFIGQVHLFDWDEINFAESAREMLVTDNWRVVQINFQAFYEKPPLFIWLQALSMQQFGVNEFAARLPNAICGIITLLVVFNVGRNIFKSQFGVLWALMFCCSILPQIYFKSGLIDPVFNLLIFLGIFYLFKVTTINEFEPAKTTRRNRRYYLLLSGLFIGLAALTKGPVAILVTVLTSLVYFVVNRGKLKLEFSDFIVWGLTISSVVMVWLGFEIKVDGINFLKEFYHYQLRLLTTKDAGHGGPFYYHIVVLLIGVFPASALMWGGLRKNMHDDPSQLGFKRWMIYLLCVVLVVFSIVQTKIIHYSSLCWYPITFLAAYYLNHLFDGRINWNWKQTTPLLILGVLIITAFTGGVFLMQRQDVFINYIKDPFAVDCLQAKVIWTRNDLFFGLGYIICIVISILLTQTRHVKWGTYLLIISSTIFINTLMTLIVPRVERYSQHALIEFLETKQKENCTIQPAFFKSYAHYFYARVKPPLPADSLQTEYVITKSSKAEQVMKDDGRRRELYRKNGWVFIVVDK